MELNSGNFLLIGSILLFTSVVVGKYSNKFGTPTLLLFLIIGMIFGSDGFGIQFDSPQTTQFIGMLALSIILFSGGMDTNLSDIKPVIKQGIILSTVGVFLTALLTGGFIYWLTNQFGLNFSLSESMLLASVMASTDSASVFSILRSKKQGLKEKLRPMLELESGSNDPMAYILTILLIDVVSSPEGIDIWHSILMFFVQMSVGALFGYLLGKLAVFIINKIDIGNKSLYSVLLLSFVLFIFSFTDLCHGNGYLAVYIAGLMVGNNKITYKRSLSSFFDGLTWLFQIVIFISLGLLVNPNELWNVSIIGTLIGIFVMLVSRPISVFLCLSPFRQMTRKAKLYVSWVGLRGAVPIIFATYPMVAGLEHAHIIFNIVFFITILSLITQGNTVSSSAKLLKLSIKEKEKGFDIDLPDEVKAKLIEMDVKPEFLINGCTMRDVSLPPDILVMMVKRGNEYIVPRGNTKLMIDDKLLFIKQDK